MFTSRNVIFWGVLMKKLFIVSVMICGLYSFAIQPADYDSYDSDSDRSELSTRDASPVSTMQTWYDDALRGSSWSKEASIPLDTILEAAEASPEYKAGNSYQQIVDEYCKLHPYTDAVGLAGKASLDIYLDTNTGESSGMSKFLMAYRKVPTWQQESVKLRNLAHGNPQIKINGIAITKAKTMVDWMKDNSYMIRNSKVQELLALLDA